MCTTTFGCTAAVFNKETKMCSLLKKKKADPASSVIQMCPAGVAYSAPN